MTYFSDSYVRLSLISVFFSSYEHLRSFTQLILFVLRFNVPVNNVSVMLGQSQRFLGCNQYCGELMCLAHGTQHSAPSGDQTQGLLIRSLMLYYYATAHEKCFIND